MKRAMLSGISLLMVLMLTCQQSFTQNIITRPLVISFYNNATLLPGAGQLGVWGVPVHPGVSAGTEFRYNDDAKNEWFQTAKFSYHYHRYVQHSIQLFSEIGYRYHFNRPFDVESRLGLGYLHAISDAQIFELNEQGSYERKRTLGRPQAMASLSIGGGYRFQQWGDLRLFVAYQFYVQVPFVNEYVPVLPNTALHLGVAFPFFKTK